MNSSIIIPNWNGRKLLEKHLKSILAAYKNRKNGILEIIIVDDKSSDDSVDYLLENYSEIKLIRNKENLGFSKSCNKGVKNTKGDLVVLINTDVSVEDDFLKNVYSHFENERVFAVGLHEKKYGPASAKFEDGFLIHRNLGEKTDNDISFWASGGSAVFRKEQWINLGGFDEEVLSPFYWEDVDLSYRAQKRGLIVKWEKTALVTHEHESVINNVNFNRNYLSNIKERNYLLFHWKNLTSESMFRQHMIGVLKRIIKHPGYIKILIYALTKINLVLKARKREKLDLLVSDEDIFSNYIQ